MKIIDLSQPLYDEMPVYDGDPEVKIEIDHTYETHSWLLRKLTLGSHTGTHVDACSHMDAKGHNLDEVPLEQFMGDAWIADGLLEYPTGDGLIYRNPCDLQDYTRILEAKPRFVAGNISEELERALLNEGIITYTNLINLEQLPSDESFFFIGLPLKIKDADGSPVRAIALVENH